MKEPTDKQLIDAVNLLCEYVEQNIADGWELALEMNCHGSSFTLTDSSGEEVFFDSDGGSSVRAACGRSREECDG